MQRVHVPGCAALSSNGERLTGRLGGNAAVAFAQHHVAERSDPAASHRISLRHARKLPPAYLQFGAITAKARGENYLAKTDTRTPLNGSPPYAIGWCVSRSARQINRPARRTLVTRAAGERARGIREKAFKPRRNGAASAYATTNRALLSSAAVLVGLRIFDGPSSCTSRRISRVCASACAFTVCMHAQSRQWRHMYSCALVSPTSQSTSHRREGVSSYIVAQHQAARGEPPCLSPSRDLRDRI